MTSSIVKWAGGKSCMIEKIVNLIGNTEYDRFVDPFCGSLALPLQLSTSKLLLNDINAPLIYTYKSIQDHPEEVLNILEQYNSDDMNSPEQYGEMRIQYNNTKNNPPYNLEMPARFIYLNKRCFNGLYRENNSGQFNVPYREYKGDIYSEEAIKNFHTWCRNREIEWRSQNYDEIFDMCVQGDLVYIDPPYYPSKGKSDFTAYWKTGFSVQEQEKLAQKVLELDSRGIYFIMSNTPCDEVRNLYEGFYQESFCITRSMRSGKGKSKNNDEDNEMLITNIHSNLEFED